VHRHHTREPFSLPGDIEGNSARASAPERMWPFSSTKKTFSAPESKRTPKIGLEGRHDVRQLLEAVLELLHGLGDLLLVGIGVEGR
jgi:hypothetical protein